MRAFSSVNTAREVAIRTFGPTTTLPCPRIRATGRLPSAAASDLPSAALTTSMFDAPPAASRISHTGTPTCRNEALWITGRSGCLVMLNGMMPMEWVWITESTSGRTL